MSRPAQNRNKFRAAMEILTQGRDRLVEAVAEEVLDQGPDLLESGYQFNEFLEVQGSRLHFVTLLLGQLEQSADSLDEVIAAAQPPRSRARKPRQARPKKVGQPVAAEETSEEK